MKTKSILGLAVVMLAFALGGREAAADHVFQLADVMFQAGIGGTATGTFTTNDAITALVTYDITTSTAGSFPGFEYTPATAPNVMNVLPTGVGLQSFPPGHVFALTFIGGLTATGAPSVSGGEFSAGAGERSIVSGSVVAVPEPSSLVLGGIAAAAGLGLWARRRVSTATLPLRLAAGGSR
jgi:hypothetical protein